MELKVDFNHRDGNDRIIVDLPPGVTLVRGGAVVLRDLTEDIRVEGTIESIDDASGLARVAVDWRTAEFEGD